MRTVSMDSSIRCLAAVVVLWSVLPATPSFGASGATAQTPGSAGAAQSAAGLRSELETILQASKDPNSARFGDLLNSLKVPAGANWFAAAFGDEAGAKLAAAYEASWADYRAAVVKILGDAAAGGHGEVTVKEFASSSETVGDSFIETMFEDAKTVLTLYRATTAGKHGDEPLPGIYVYVRGAFRIVNLATFYGLPDVQPPHVRLGSDELQGMLIHQVNPAWPAGVKHGQGAVILHVVIGVNGVVKQVDILAGDPDRKSVV